MKAIIVNTIYVKDTEIYEVEELKDHFTVLGYTDDLSALRSQGYCVRRKELDNQPILQGLLGPMWDGNRLRYETPEVYDTLSR